MYENMKTALEIEKKYIIKKPSIDDLRSYPGFTESEILQIYIQGGEGETHRVRRRIKGGVTVYTETIKRRVDKMSSTETEGEISK